MQIELAVGPQAVLAAGGPKLRGLADGSLAVADAHGRYQEALYRGNCYYTSNATSGVTAAAASTSLLAAGTGKPILGIWNPYNSGVMASIQFLDFVHISGTPGTGLYWNIGQQGSTLISAGTVSPVAALTGQATGSRCFAMNTVAATTGSVVGVLHRTVPSNFFAGALAAGAGPLGVSIDYGGSMLVLPGTFLAIGVGSSGSSWVLGGTLSWEEIAYPFG